MKQFSRGVLALSMCALCAGGVWAEEGAHEAHWSYTGDTGPSHWGDLKSGSPVCKTGMKQSPVDLLTTAMTHKAAPFTQKYATSPVSVVNNGHSIQANLGNKSNTLSYDKDVYRLQQFHFHAPSEHTLDGVYYPMELHLVHSDANDHLTVVGVFIKEGAANSALDEMFAHLPDKVGAAGMAETVNLAALLPKSKKAYTYSGSLTTPPCSEAVNWIVLQEPITLSPQQIARFRALYMGNNRPLQALHDRSVNGN